MTDSKCQDIIYSVKIRQLFYRHQNGERYEVNRNGQNGGSPGKDRASHRDQKNHGYQGKGSHRDLHRGRQDHTYEIPPRLRVLQQRRRRGLFQR